MPPWLGSSQPDVHAARELHDLLAADDRTVGVAENLADGSVDVRRRREREVRRDLSRGAVVDGAALAPVPVVMARVWRRPRATSLGGPRDQVVAAWSGRHGPQVRSPQGAQ